jgi:hypothetical protein
MYTLAVMEHPDVREGGGLHGVPSGEALPEDALVLEAVEPALARGVVPAVALAAHRADHAVVRKLLLEGMTRTGSPEGSGGSVPGRLAPKPTSGQRVADEIGCHALLQRPPMILRVNRPETTAKCTKPSSVPGR